MAFGNKGKITKEDLVEAGLDPDKLKEYVEKGVTKDMLDAVKTELTTSMTQTITDQLKAGFTELENKLKPTTNTNNNNNGGNGNGNQNNDDDLTDMDRFTSDPTKYVNDKVGSLEVRAAVEIMKTRRQIAYDSLSNTLKGFQNEALKNEIEEEWKKYTPEVLVRNGGDPSDLLRKIHNMILGAHQDDIIRDSNKKDGKYNLVHSGASSSNSVVNNGGLGNNNTDGTKRELSIAEKKLAKEFGMTDEEWLKQEDEMAKEEELRHAKAGAR